MTETTFYYILVDHEPKPVRDRVTWARWMATVDRHVAETRIGTLWISTIFLGVDHNYNDGGKPILFETMIFGFDEDDSYQTRCHTWDEAVRMHALAKDIAETLVREANTSLAMFKAKLMIADDCADLTKPSIRND